jgi:hypothetical protein
MFYVYQHKKPDGIPFYVGKGKGPRAYQFSKRSAWHKNVVAKHGRKNISVEIIECQSEQDAFELERQLIAELTAAGIELVNLTDGGEGASGLERGTPTEEHRAKNALAKRGNTFRRGSRHTEESKEKMSANRRGKPLPEHVRLLLVGNTFRRGSTHTDEAKEKNRLAHLGHKQSAETIEKRRAKLCAPRTSKKGLSGVSWYKPSGKWVVHIPVSKGAGKNRTVGYFTDFFEACCARKSAELTVYKSDSA